MSVLRVAEGTRIRHFVKLRIRTIGSKCDVIYPCLIMWADVWVVTVPIIYKALFEAGHSEGPDPSKPVAIELNNKPE